MNSASNPHPTNVAHCLLQSDFKSDPVKAGWRTETFTNQNGECAWVSAPGGTEHSIHARLGFWESPLLEVNPFHYYRLTFRSKAGPGGYWAILFSDANAGPIQSDVYDALPASEDWQDHEFCFRTYALAAKLVLRFQGAGESMAVENVRLSETNVGETASWIARFTAQCPPVAYVAPTPRGALLPLTFKRLQEGGRFRMLLLGDSIACDTGNSLFETLLKKRYPKTDIEVINSVRSSTSCTWYQHENRVQDYVLRFNPDLLIIAGISHAYDAKAIRSVIQQVRAKQNIEILVLTDSITPETMMKAGFIDNTKLDPEVAGKIISEFPGKLRSMAQEEKVELLDMRTPWEDYLKSSNKPEDWFHRDAVHANFRGKQVMGQILSRYFAPLKSK